MEDNIQTIITVIISVFLLFIFPVYMAYEKKDDISYALAMRYTQDLVDNVRSRGYLTKEMYEDYVEKLGTTGNTYNVELTHEYNRYDPITNYYKIENGKYVITKTTTQFFRNAYDRAAINGGISRGELTNNYTEEEKEEYLANVYKNDGIDKVEDTYQLSQQVYKTDYILNILAGEKKFLYNSSTGDVNCEDNNLCVNAYIMNEGDNFNVTIKNTNTTLATVMYNMVTANTIDDNTRIYVNYGGAILANKWYGQIDYSVMDHDNITIQKYQEVTIFNGEKIYTGDSHDIANRINHKATDYSYGIEFEVKPEKITELREKGTTELSKVYKKYNFACGSIGGEEKNHLGVSIGINGISIISNNRKIDEYKVVLSYPITIDKYTKVKIHIDKISSGRYLAILYLNDERVAESVEMEKWPSITHIGRHLNINFTFTGAIKNAKIIYYE